MDQDLGQIALVIGGIFAAVVALLVVLVHLEPRPDAEVVVPTRPRMRVLAARLLTRLADAPQGTLDVPSTVGTLDPVTA